MTITLSLVVGGVLGFFIGLVWAGDCDCEEDDDIPLGGYTGDDNDH